MNEKILRKITIAVFLGIFAFSAFVIVLFNLPKADEGQSLASVPITMTGKVTFTNGQPAAGVSILLDNHGHGLGSDGKYEIEVMSGKTLPIRFFNFEAGEVYQLAKSFEQDLYLSDRETYVTRNFIIEKVGSNLPTLPQCSDTTDNDGDNRIDYPNDPGCSNGNDTDERDPVTPTPRSTAPVSPTNITTRKQVDMTRRQIIVTLNWTNDWIDSTSYTKEVEIQRGPTTNPISFKTIARVALTQTSYNDRPPYSLSAQYYYRLRSCKIVLNQRQCSNFSSPVLAR